MRTILYSCRVGLALLVLVSCQAVAQTSGPRKPPVARTPASPSTSTERSMTSSSDAPAEAKIINGVEITLLEVNGSSIGQTVAATMRIKNPSGNTEICTQQAYGVDTDGNQYQSMAGRNCAPLYTHVPLKWMQGVKGIPSKVKTLALLTLNLYNKNTRKSEVAEFRNLTINWQ